jgi:hypothetical protein
VLRRLRASLQALARVHTCFGNLARGEKASAEETPTHGAMAGSCLDLGHIAPMRTSCTPLISPPPLPCRARSGDRSDVWMLRPMRIRRDSVASRHPQTLIDPSPAEGNVAVREREREPGAGGRRG